MTVVCTKINLGWKGLKVLIGSELPPKYPTRPQFKIAAARGNRQRGNLLLSRVCVCEHDAGVDMTTQRCAVWLEFKSAVHIFVKP